uniref:Aminopeptidase n=1 Tax=Nothobranchius furzeri TaxID=105023 RepID=A0A1A7ZZL2_NOTFU
MGKVYHFSKNAVLGTLVLAVTALATIIALSVAYHKERANNQSKPGNGASGTSSTSAPPTTPFTPKVPWDYYRLPKGLKPESYNVTLWPRLKPNSDGLYIFTGNSTVVFRCLKDTDLIIIHANKLNFTTFEGMHAKLSSLHEEAVPALQKSWLTARTEYLVVQLQSKLKAGAMYALHTEFMGELADDLEGFYRSEYLENGLKKIVATSQMQPTYARQAFPCFDEPAMKAIFNITIIHDPDTVALSNGKEKNQIALPDFNAGAMENWGLVTYRETALLYDPMLSSTGNKERVTTVIAHELAHMWFGNLVTLHWWNDLWLNEGFASYVEYLGADYAEPTWNIKDDIILYDVQKVLAIDALASSHPLSRKEEEVSKPAEISEMFNSISYNKGAAVLRMLSEFLTEPVFARGLSSYLNTFAFKNTVYTDLWDHLQQAVDNTPGLDIPRSVSEIMNRWTLQMGFPVVTVDTQTGTVTQKHFLLDPDSVVGRPSQFNYTWFIPIKWMKNGVDQQQYWLLDKTDTHSSMRVSGEEWVLANTNVSGFFRVNYDLDNWGRLLSQLNTNHQVLSVINRAQIIDDAFSLARAKLINTTLALRTTTYLSRERDYIPWESALRNLDNYVLIFDRTEVYGALQAYLKKQIKPLFEHFRTLTANWTRVPAGHSDQYNQINALRIACGVGVEGCRELIKSWYRQWMENPDHNQIHPNLKSTVYCNAIAFGGVEEWDFAWRMFQTASLASEASRLRSAMACTKTPWLLNRYLEYTLDPTKIRKQDSISTIQYIARNVVGMPLAWNFVRARWSYIFEQYGQGSFSFTNLISGITMRFSTEFELQELKRFKEDNLHVGFGSATLALEQAIEKTTANIKWVNENKAEVFKWFIKETT